MPRKTKDNRTPPILTYTNLNKFQAKTENQLRKVLLNDFQYDVNKRTITMQSWKNKDK